MRRHAVILQAHVDEHHAISAGLAHGPTIGVAFKGGLKSTEVGRGEAPEGFEIVRNEVIFVGELDVVLFNVVPPMCVSDLHQDWEHVCAGKGKTVYAPPIKPLRRTPPIPSPVLCDRLVERLALPCELRFPFLFRSLDEVEDRVSAVGVDFEQAVGPPFVGLEGVGMVGWRRVSGLRLPPSFALPLSLRRGFGVRIRHRRSLICGISHAGDRSGHKPLELSAESMVILMCGSEGRECV
jgi:hypothetical protein